LKKKSNKKEAHRGDEHVRRQEAMPDYSLDMMDKIIFDHNDWIFRKDVAWKLLHKDPSLGKFMITSEPPFGLLFKKSILDEIKQSMPIKKKLKLFESAKVKSDGLVFISVGKISGMKRRIERKAGKVVYTSNSHSGMKHLKGATLPDVARKLYDILKYNAGQIDTWHTHAKIFNDRCDNKHLVKAINLYTKLAMDKKVLPVLRDDVKLYTDTI